jgi:RHS repeat-associated protein
LGRRTFAGFGTASGTPPTYESSIIYSYDQGNRLASGVDSVTGTITPKYDRLDRLISEQTAQGTVSYDYDPSGRRASMTVAGQTFVSYTYDNANRLTQITQGSATVSFAYDAGNRATSLTLPNGVVMSYSYDNASQLTGINYTNGSTNLGSLNYSYDLAGRRTSMGGSLAQTALPLPVNEAEYNANNQLTEWGTASLFYDANGNMTSDGANSYVWNARNQLDSMNLGANSFTYDGYGRRVGKTIPSMTTNYLYDGANVVQELSSGSATANLLTGGIDQVFTRTDSSGTANFLTDALGSTLELTNSSGSTLAQYSYEPFGNTFITSGASGNSYQYTGRENDGTGLYFYRARYYSPSLDRFVSQDPIGPGSGINVYSYVMDAPTDWVDPLGLVRCVYVISMHTLICNSDDGTQEFDTDQALSGYKGCMNNPECANKTNEGPIPPGSYRLGGLGSTPPHRRPRIPIYKARDNPTHRDNFEFHEGRGPFASQGCIAFPRQVYQSFSNFYWGDNSGTLQVIE